MAHAAPWLAEKERRWPGGAEALSPDQPAPFTPQDATQGLGTPTTQEHDIGRTLLRRAEPIGGAARAAPLRPRHTDWLNHWLLVASPASTLADFQAAACGAGTIP